MHVLGIDVGGSGIKGAPVDTVSGTLAAPRLRVSTPPGAYPEDVANAVARVIDHFAWTDRIGVAMPVRVKYGIAKTAANVDDSWIGTDVQALFHTASGLAVTVSNDADAAGIAEMRFGTGRSEQGVVLMLTVGTGIGSSLFIGRRLVPNTELGHLRFRGGSGEDHAANSVRKSLRLSWEDWARRLNEYLTHVSFLLDPDLIIVGGGVSRPKRTAKYWHFLDPTLPVRPAALQNEAGIIGAACAALEQ